ncbi:MAG: hypothetical protein J6Q15_01165 [Clostridia bacterium]|nr:hypothetical protein [Clostridia bacterium]
MKKYRVNYAYDEEVGMYMGICLEFFGCSLYAETIEQLKRSMLNAVRVFAEDQTVSGKDIEFNEILLNQECGLEL